MKPQIITLSNGLRVILIDTKTFPSVTTLLMLGAGSRYENKKNNGIAHFLEHMPYKGSVKYPNSFIISSLIEGLGGVFNAYTSKDHVAYWAKSPIQHFEEILDVIADCVLHPLLDSEEMEKEKGVIVEEINMYEDSPSRTVGELFEQLLYSDNALGMDTLGTKKTVTSFTRETFTDYMDKLYHPKNAVLVVAGGLSQSNVIPEVPKTEAPESQSGNRESNRGIKSPRSSEILFTPDRVEPSLSHTRAFQDDTNSYEKYLKIIEEKFGLWVGDKSLDFEQVKEVQMKPASFIKYKKTEQAHFCLGYRAFSFFDQRRYALSVLSNILGGGMSSRLFMEVREKRGLCYYVSTGRQLYHDVGYLVTQAGVPIVAEKIQEAVKVIIDEHNKVSNGDVTDDEVRRAKEMIKGRLILSLEDSENIASMYGTKLLLTEETEDPEEMVKKIDAVTKDQVVSLAKELFRPENLNFTLIGPFKDKSIIKL